MLRNLLVLPSGEELFSGQIGENALASVKLTRCVNAEEELAPGSVCAGLLEASVIAPKALPLTAGDEVILYRVSDDGTRKKEGVFIAEKPVWESANRYSLTAYDRVSLLDKDLSQWLGNLQGWPYALLDFASMVCSQCGLELISQEIPNADYPVQAFSGEGITGRQLMQWAAQVAGRFCRANADGQIEFAWYKNTNKVVGPGETVIQKGPEQVVTLEEMRAGEPLQVVSEIAPSLSKRTSLKLYRRGCNVLDLQTVGIYHSIDHSGKTHIMDINETGFRLEIAMNQTLPDRTLWGFCLGTPQELAGKTITISADYTTSLTGIHAIPYLGVFSTDEEPIISPRKNLNANLGGYLAGGTFSALATKSGSGVRAVSYTVTGRETRTYIAAFFAFCNPGRIAIKAGEWSKWDNIQVEYSDTPSPYQPYRYEIFTRKLPSVCGGNLNWSTGVLTVTHGKIDSYSGETVSEGWISSTGKLSNGAQVVYPLEKPYTVQLTPEQIPAIAGTNILWSNTGNTQISIYEGYYFGGSLQLKDYTVAPIEKVQIRLTEEDVGAIYPDDLQAQNTYILSGNFLLTNADGQALEGVAKGLYEELKSITYTPCKLELPASVGVEPGDILTVKDRKGNTVTIYVMSKTCSGQRDKLECTGSPRRNSVLAVNEQSYKALSGKVLELRTDIDGLHLAHKDAKGAIAQLELTTEGICADVVRQQAAGENLAQQITSVRQTADQVSIAVQEIRDNGISKVKTQMGYTFDDRGLQISRSDGEMSNLLDNTGMYVKRGKDVVLQANNEGVEAMNITVRNYLSVGAYARFEDYNDGSGKARTACFFTGG